MELDPCRWVGRKGGPAGERSTELDPCEDFLRGTRISKDGLGEKGSLITWEVPS